MLMTIGLVLAVVGYVGYKVQTDIRKVQIRKEQEEKVCDASDPSYCFDCTRAKWCSSIRR